MKLGFYTIKWADNKVKILDQTLLPTEVVYKDIGTPEAMAEAIKSLRVRGAPLIGVSAAYGVALGAYRSNAQDYPEFRKDVFKAIEIIHHTRPTAYNLFAALERMKEAMKKETAVPGLKDQLLQEAHNIKKEDEKLCTSIGYNGVTLISQDARIMTQCNAGALATAGIGTALAPVYLAQEQGKNPHIFVPETRPVLQGARLTAWELTQARVRVTLICDSARGMVFRQKPPIDLCIVGADRIARNGDTANKIGTYSLAVLAKTHNIPFYIAAPTTTFDPKIESGNQIPIEERHPDEIRKVGSCQIAPPETPVFNPAFDVTPHEYITAFITEKGILKPPF